MYVYIHVYMYRQAKGHAPPTSCSQAPGVFPRTQSDRRQRRECHPVPPCESVTVERRGRGGEGGREKVCVKQTS